LEQTRLSEEALQAESRIPPEKVTVNPLLIPSLLTRARLCAATRLAEERRLALRERRVKALRNRKPRDKRTRPWTAKQATKRKFNKKEFQKSGGFGAILRARGYKKIDKELWDRYIKPLYDEYSVEYLEIKLYKRVPVAISEKAGIEPAKRAHCYFGTKEFPYTVYTLDVNHKLLGTLYSGYEQAIQDGVEFGNFSATPVV
jgi:hypothetical protein